MSTNNVNTNFIVTIDPPTKHENVGYTHTLIYYFKSANNKNRSIWTQGNLAFWHITS